MRSLYRILSLLTTAKAAQRGPGALGRQLGRRQAAKISGRAMRKLLKP